MSRAADAVAAAMPELQAWIGRREVIEDEISLTTAQRIAAMLDQDPTLITKDSALPRQWFGLFFASNARQCDIALDGHPVKGLFLPPIPLPRRMGAGRRVTITRALTVGVPATRTVEVLAIEPKSARTGQLVVLTLRQTFAQGGRTIAVEDLDAVYREGLPPGAKNPVPPPVAPPAGAQWSDSVLLSNALIFRYSAITWNAHRIHYDADYARGDEGYQGVVHNGGLTQQLIIDAGVKHLPGPLTGIEARLSRPLWAGNPLRIEGGRPEGGKLACWGVDKDGALAASITLNYGG
jgi:3-methylfumaryl-CoA hydratase